MVVSSREKASDLINSARFAIEIPSKLKSLRLLKDLLFERDPSLLSEVIPCLAELQTDPASPLRKFLAEYALLILHSSHSHVQFNYLKATFFFLHLNSIFFPSQWVFGGGENDREKPISIGEW